MKWASSSDLKIIAAWHGQCFGDTMRPGLRSRAHTYDGNIYVEIMDHIECHSPILRPVYIFAPPILKLFGKSDEISELGGKFAIWMLPQLFAYALNFPVQKFLQSQSKVMAMAWISALALVFHIFLRWLFIIKLEWGLVGAAVTLNLSWWIVVLGQLTYVVSGNCPGAWNGLS